MAIHYISDIRHITCLTTKGRRRSPVQDIAYNSGQTLTDLSTGRTHHRAHTDGTKIIDTDIVSFDPTCKYADDSVPSNVRREQMYDELYRLNKCNNAEQIYAKMVAGLPNSANERQCRIIARAMALALSKKLGRPVDYSVHFKNGNNHVHFVWSERAYAKGKWKAKSISYYIDRNGNPIFDKKYKDQDGNDIRAPRTIKKEAPIYETDPNTGKTVCINQVRDSKGRRKWKMTDTAKIKKEDVSWIHNEMDNIINQHLSLFNIPDRVKRNDRRVTEKLKEFDMVPVHIGRKDYQAKNESYEQKIARNKKSTLYRDTLTEIYKTHDKLAEFETKMDKEEKESAENLLAATEKTSTEKQTMDNAKLDYQSALADYVEELRPQEIFVQTGISLLNGYMTQREKILTETAYILQDGIQLADKELSTVSKKANAKELPIIKGYLTKNKSYMDSLLSSIRQYAKKVPVIKTVTKFLADRWQSFSSTEKVAYICDTVGQEEGVLYADYLNVKEVKINTPNILPFSVPKIGTEEKIMVTLQAWKEGASKNVHYPPMNINLLQAIQSQDQIVMGTSTGQNIIPNAYDPMAAYKQFSKDFNAIREQQKAVQGTERQSVTASQEPIAKNVKETENQSVAANPEQVNWNRKEYDRLGALRDAEKLRKMQETADARIKAGTDYTKEELITRYKKHSKELTTDMRKYGIDHSTLDRLSADAKAYWQKGPGPKYLALQKQKKASAEQTADRESIQTVRK